MTLASVNGTKFPVRYMCRSACLAGNVRRLVIRNTGSCWPIHSLAGEEGRTASNVSPSLRFFSLAALGGLPCRVQLCTPGQKSESRLGQVRRARKKSSRLCRSVFCGRQHKSSPSFFLSHNLPALQTTRVQRNEKRWVRKK